MGRTSDAKEKLLNVAFDLIWDNSYGTVSVDQICERAKVNKGSFYYYFQTKADLAVAAYDEHWRLKQPEMDRLFSAQIPPLERLSNWCKFVYQTQKEKAEKHGRPCGCPYATIGTEIANQEDMIRAKAGELMSRGAKYLESAIADAKREGSVAVEDPRAAAHQVHALVLGLGIAARIQGNLSPLEHLESSVMAIIGAKTAVPA